LLVARAGRTPTKAVEEAIEILGRKSILGVVLNGMEESAKSYYKYRHYYKDRK
jgi:Mrp family chromosome partitioning ATPase